MNYAQGMQVNIHEAKTQLSRLLELVEEGETVVIARHARPVAELVRARKTGLPLGIAQQDRLAPPGDGWWQPMTGEEADDFGGGSRVGGDWTARPPGSQDRSLEGSAP